MILIDIVIVFISYYLYIYLSKDTLQDLNKSDIELQKQLKQTIHELNTPISTIKLNTKMIYKNCTNDKDIQRLQRIEKASNNLLKIYNDMEYKIQKEVNNIEIIIFNLENIIKNCVDNFQDIKKEVIININIQEDIQILTDKNGFEIIINNIISNALKYNKNNNDINIYYQNKILHIDDKGIGIDIKNIFKIYDSYYQEDKFSKGFGLGLNIVKSFCDSNNIKLKIDSRINHGTSLQLYLGKLTHN